MQRQVLDFAKAFRLHFSETDSIVRDLGGARHVRKVVMVSGMACDFRKCREPIVRLKDKVCPILDQLDADLFRRDLPPDDERVLRGSRSVTLFPPDGDSASQGEIEDSM